MRRLLTVRSLLWLLGLMLVVPLATVECVYRYTLLRLPELPSSPTRGLSDAARLRATWWRDLDSSARHVQPIGSWTVVHGLLGFSLSRPACMHEALPEGFEHALDAASRWLNVLNARTTVPFSETERIALAIWFTRHWSEEEWRVDAIESRWHLSSVKRGAPVFLARSWTQLPVEDLTLLMAMDRLSQRADPWCEREQLHTARDALLRTLHERQGLDATELATALQAPLFLTVRPIEWGPCEQPAVTQVLEPRLTTVVPE